MSKLGKGGSQTKSSFGSEASPVKAPKVQGGKVGGRKTVQKGNPHQKHSGPK